MNDAVPARSALVSGHMGGVLCILLMAGCAAIEPSPRPAAPVSATAGVDVSNPTQGVPASQVAEPMPSTATQPVTAALSPPVPVPVPPAAQAPSRTAPLVSGRDAPPPAASAPKAPTRVAAAPAPAAPVQKPPAPAPAQPSAPPPLDLKSLETRLKETKAIGVFSKIALKNQIDDLLDRFRAYYQGQLKTSLAELRHSFDMLVLKVVALLQDADPPLAGAVVSSRESLWDILSNRARFEKL